MHSNKGISQKMLGITGENRMTKTEVHQRMANLIGKFEPLLTTAKRRKLQWFGKITRKEGTLVHTIMYGGVEGETGRVACGH